MFCTKCGNKLDLDSKFCTKCGLSANTNNISNINGIVNKPFLNVKKRSIIISAIVTIFIFITILIIFLNNNSSNNRTIMIYMIGSNLETDGAAAVTDISEMLDSKVDFSKNTILIYTGGAKVWNDYDIPSDKNVIYKLTNKGLKELKIYDKKSMVNSNTLTEFLNYSYKNYKAKNYDLILWDHGGGPIYGYGSDQNFPIRMMSIADLSTSLKNSSFNKEKLEILGFDACLMSSIEIAQAISPYAKYLISSQEAEPGDGWNYEYLKELDKNISSVSLSKKIIDYYYEYYKKYNYKGGIGLSLIDTSKINKLNRELSKLFSTIDSNIEIDFSELSFARANTKTYGKADKQVYDLADLKDLIDNLPSKYSSKSDILDIITNDAVVYQKTDIIDSNGISIYFPYYNVDSIQKNFNIYKTLNFNSEYTEFIKKYVNKLTGDQLKLPSISKVKATTNNEIVSIDLPQEIIANASKYSYMIFEKNSNNYYTFIYKGFDVEVDKSTNKISTNTSKKAIYVNDNEGNGMYIASIGSDNVTGGTNYYISGMVQNWADDLSDLKAEAVFLEYFVNNNGESKIGKVIPLSNNSNGEYYASKKSYDLTEWKTFSLTNSSRKILDDNGNYTNNWELGTIIGLEWTDFSEDDINIELKELSEARRDLA
jgi:hypothetical protein